MEQRRRHAALRKTFAVRGIQASELTRIERHTTICGFLRAGARACRAASAFHHGAAKYQARCEGAGYRHTDVPPRRCKAPMWNAWRSLAATAFIAPWQDARSRSSTSGELRVRYRDVSPRKCEALTRANVARLCRDRLPSGRGRMPALYIMGRSQAVRHRVLIPAFAGSNPAAPVSRNRSMNFAQMIDWVCQRHAKWSRPRIKSGAGLAVCQGKKSEEDVCRYIGEG